LVGRRIEQTTEALDAYDAFAAGGALERFVDQLSNWYVRRNRRRFWKAASGEDKQAAYATLYECLATLTRLLAPFVPFISETIYQNLVRGIEPAAPLSVHMTDWPARDPARLDERLLAEAGIGDRVRGRSRSARNSPHH